MFFTLVYFSYNSHNLQINFIILFLRAAIIIYFLYIFISMIISYILHLISYILYLILYLISYILLIALACEKLYFWHL